MNKVFWRIDSLPHGWNVLASIFIGGAITALAYALSSAGLAELAGTFLTYWVVFCFQRLFSKMAGSRKGHFAGSSAMLRQFQQDAAAWMRDRTVLSIFLLGFFVAVAFTAARSGVIGLLQVFGNPWFALAGGLLVAALVASPVLFRDLGAALGSGSEGDEPHEN